MGDNRISYEESMKLVERERSVMRACVPQPSFVPLLYAGLF